MPCKKHKLSPPLGVQNPPLSSRALRKRCFTSICPAPSTQGAETKKEGVSQGELQTGGCDLGEKSELWDETGLHWVSADQHSHLREPPPPGWKPDSLQPQPWHPPFSHSGKSAPVRDQRGHERESVPYRFTADSGREAKNHPRPPAHQETSHGNRGRDSGMYTLGAVHQLISTDKRSPLLAAGSSAPQWTPGTKRWGQQAEPLTEPSAGQTGQQAKRSPGDGEEELERGRQVHDCLWSGYKQWPSPVGPCVLHRLTNSVSAQQPQSSHTDRLHTPWDTHIHTLTHTLTHTHTHTHTPPTHTLSHTVT